MGASGLPGEDWYQYVNGGWQRAAEIPADEASWTSFSEVETRVRQQLRELLDEQRDTGSLVGNFYASFLDEAKLEQLGAKPVQPVLSQIRAIANKGDFAAFAGFTNYGFGSSLFGFGVGADAKNPDMNVALLSQGGLGMAKDYYSSPRFAPIKEGYHNLMVRLFELAAWPAPNASAAKVMAFETEVAQQAWSPTEMRDPDKTYRKLAFSEIAKKAPGFDWYRFMQSVGPVSEATEVVAMNWNEEAKNGIIGIAALVGRTDLDALRAWSAWHVLTGAAPYLSKDFLEAVQVYKRLSTGVTSLAPRWERAVAAASSNLGDAVGELYVAKHFPASSKKLMDELTPLLKEAFRERLLRASWMTEPTRAAALEKLASFTFEVGYPSKYLDYSSVHTSPEDLYGNVERIQHFAWAWDLYQLGAPVDKAYWPYPPQTINAMFEQVNNRCIFYAALLQPPFFDANGDMAVNFGAIGSVIGHEMTHGFDDQGRKYDAKGRMRDWWTEADVKEFSRRADDYGEQFANFTEGLPDGMRILPKLTMGENIADLGGVTISHEALQKWLRTHPYAPRPPLLGEGGLEPEADRRFMLGWAQLWRAKYRTATLEAMLTTDPHPPATARSTIPLQNTDPWYSAYGVTAGDRLFLKPAQRVTIW